MKMTQLDIQRLKLLNDKESIQAEKDILNGQIRSIKAQLEGLNINEQIIDSQLETLILYVEDKEQEKVIEEEQEEEKSRRKLKSKKLDD